MSGWYRLHRGWQDHAVFRNEAYSRRDAFVWLIEHACFDTKATKTSKGVVTLRRGQLSYSLRFMAGAWKWDVAKVRRFILALKKAKIIDTLTDTPSDTGTDASGDTPADTGQTVITISNYDRYQATADRPDTPSDTGTDTPTDTPREQNRHKDKEGRKEEEEEEEGAPARSAAGYAFSGQVVRLSAKDLAEWRSTYHGIIDIRAELASIDAWFLGKPEEDRKAWFHRAKRMLNTAHQRSLGGGAGGQSRAPTGVVVPIDDAFQRRLERAQANGAARA